MLVTARRTFDLAHAWGGKHPMDVPMVVLTHAVPKEWANREGSPFTFVTEGGVPKAIDVAREIAGEKDVVVGLQALRKHACNSGCSTQFKLISSLWSLGLDPTLRSFDEADRTLGYGSNGEPTRDSHHLQRHRVSKRFRVRSELHAMSAALVGKGLA